MIFGISYINKIGRIENDIHHIDGYALHHRLCAMNSQKKPFFVYDSIEHNKLNFVHGILNDADMQNLNHDIFDQSDVESTILLSQSSQYSVTQSETSTLIDNMVSRYQLRNRRHNHHRTSEQGSKVTDIVSSVTLI